MFIDEVLKYQSVAIVGLAKNAGKTECLNYIIDQAYGKGKRLALTSIGIDGESSDQVTHTPKPEIRIHPEMLFITSEKHYQARQTVAEILTIGDQHTALGRLVTARALTPGKVLLSGPSDTTALKQTIEQATRQGADVVLVDGALSRLSLGSPAVTDALVLATGAAVSANIPQLVRKTKYVYDLIRLEAVEENLARQLMPVEKGIWAIDREGRLHDLEIPSALMLEKYRDKLFSRGHTLFVAGVISDQLLKFLRAQKEAADICLIMKDFSKMFASMENYYAFLKKGGSIRVVQQSKLLAVCINPYSPEGYLLDSDQLRAAMEKELKVRVYDVKKVVG